MKTWWNYWPVMALSVSFPFICTGLPTTAFSGVVVGGGVIRQELVNLVAAVIPVESGQRYIDAFNTASTGEEFLLLLPVSLNISTILALITFLIVSTLLGLSNSIKRQEYKSQRKASKGAN